MEDTVAMAEEQRGELVQTVRDKTSPKVDDAPIVGG